MLSLFVESIEPLESRHKRGGIVVAKLATGDHVFLMSKAWKSSAFILLAVIGIILLLNLRSPMSVGPHSNAAKTVASDTEPKLNSIELTAFYDEDASFNAPGCWQAVPRGMQTLSGIPFRIAGLIQLWGAGPEGIGRHYRETVEGIPAAGKFQTFYVLHATSFTTSEGTPIAEVVFRYADGSSATNQIRYGTDSRDWWQPLSESNPLPTNSASKVVWRGDHPSLPDWVKSLRLFGMAIPNPKPDNEVRSVDLISTKSRVTWIVLSLATGPSGLLMMDPKLEQDEIASTEEITVKLIAIDKDTGKPIPEVRFDVTLLSGRRPNHFGAFTADDQGEAVVDLPPARIKLLSIQTISSNYLPDEMSWRVNQGGNIPTNYVFKLSKKAL